MIIPRQPATAVRDELSASGKSRLLMRILVFFTFLTFFAIGYSFRARAFMLLFVSDTISNSQPGIGANHEIIFETIDNLPPGGSIAVVPQDGSLTIPAGLDYADIDIATSSALVGPYVESSIASSTSVVSGTSGSIVITLSSAQGIAKNTFVRIRIGTNVQMVNPTGIASYRIQIIGKDSAGAEINEGTAMYAIVSGVTIAENTIRTLPPGRSNGLPAGTLPWGTTAAQISLNTDEIATCRYATASGVLYQNMGNTFAFSLGNLLHTAIVTGLASGGSYAYYVRCMDRTGNINPDDYAISFSVSNVTPFPPPNPSSTPPGPPAGSGSSGSGGFSWPYPTAPTAPTVDLRGFSYPNAHTTILRDGVDVKELSAGTDGAFKSTISLVSNGVYTFSVYAVDSSGTKSSYYSTSFFVNVGTQNTISNIFVPPTLALASTMVKPGALIAVFGQSVPKSAISISLIGQAKGGTRTATTTADGAGNWNALIPTDSLAVDTYSIKAQAMLANLGTSNYSLIAYVGVGQTPSVKIKAADLNGDGKVNLADFSIFLFDMNSQNLIADFNHDGKVGLADFSILLSQWTG
jgi:hypothetical protein